MALAQSQAGGIADFFQRRVLVMLALGFSAGLPNLLIFDTLSAWLRDEGVSLAVIGFFSLATLAYSAKFLWAPLVDRTHIPVLTGWLGHRRSWMLAAQIAIMIGLWLISGQSPAENLGAMAAFAVFVGFSGATQDIVIDAWRIEVAEDRQQGIMAAAYQWGYRIAMIVAGAVPLVLAQAYSWNLSYAAMAVLMGIGVIAVLFAPREAEHTIRPIHTEGVPSNPLAEAGEWIVRGALFIASALVAGAGLSGDPAPMTLIFGAEVFGLSAIWKGTPYSVFLQVGAVVLGLGVIALACAPLPGTRTRPGLYLGASFGAPLKDFFQRYAGIAGLILALICLYRVSDFVLNVMNPFYLDLGFSKIEIAEVRKVFGVVASMAGVFVGRMGGGEARADAGARDRRGGGAGFQSRLHRARNDRSFHAGSLCRDWRRQYCERFRRNLPYRLYVEPDFERLHSDAICAVLIALCAAGQADRLAVGPHHRRRGEIGK